MNTAAARALMGVEELSAEEVAKKAMDIASDMCVYTNKNFLSYTIVDVGDILASVENGADKK
jgi:ATP-dependent HslUV protease subunit HslV